MFYDEFMKSSIELSSFIYSQLIGSPWNLKFFFSMISILDHTSCQQIHPSEWRIATLVYGVLINLVLIMIKILKYIDIYSAGTLWFIIFMTVHFKWICDGTYKIELWSNLTNTVVRSKTSKLNWFWTSCLRLSWMSQKYYIC